MSDFKSLPINRDKIEECISSYSENTKLKDIENKGISKNYLIESDGKEVMLGFYFKKNGDTTINPKIGKYQEIGMKIAEYIKDNACYPSDSQNINFSIEKFPDSDFDLLISYIKQELHFLYNLSIKEYETIYNITCKTHDDKFILHKYKNGRVHFQGKALKIYNELYPILCEIISEEDVFRINEECYKIDIDKEEIKNEMNYKLPVSFDYLCDTTKKILTSSLALSKIEIDLFDYSPFVFSSLRGLEIFIKKVLIDKGITINGTNPFYGIFKETRYSTSELTPECQKIIICSKTIGNINDCYTYYVNHRHGLFHSNNIPETSRIIENKIEANQIIDAVFTKIERCCSEML